VADAQFGEWLRAVAPEAKTLYLSDEHERGDDSGVMLTKPFTVEALVEKVRDLLGRGTPTD
jgi:DNA-binding response OmpR family regulator